MKGLFVFLFSFLSIAVFAQKENSSSQKRYLEWKVIDKKTKEPIEDAEVDLFIWKNNIISGGLTDSNGNFSIQLSDSIFKQKLNAIIKAVGHNYVEIKCNKKEHHQIIEMEEGINDGLHIIKDRALLIKK